MISITQLYVTNKTIDAKNISTRSNGPDPNCFDRVQVNDKIGNLLEIDAGTIHMLLTALAKSRSLDLIQYLSKFKLSVE
jgi:hypothetical protein